MTDKNADTDILIEDDPPAPASPEPEIKVEAAKPEPAKPVEPEEGLDVLKAQLETERAGRESERQARLAAEARANAQAEAATKAQTETQESNLQLVTGAIETVKQARDVLKGRYAEAMAAGDFTAAADVQTEMSDAAAKLLQLETGLSALKAQPKPKPAQIITTDPVEALAQQLPAPSAAWVRAHPQYATDPGKYQMMIAAHNLAVGGGIAADTPEYFAHVERSLGIAPTAAAGADDSALSEAAQTVQRRVSPEAAPVSRNGSVNGTSPRTVRLTADELEIAELNGQSPEEYAKAKMALQREGRLTH